MFSVLILFLSLKASANTCEQWFKDSKIKLGKDCVMSCSTHSVDMGTFDCPSQCQKLCKPKQLPDDNQLDSIIDVAGLSQDEMLLIAKHPIAAKTVYEQKGIAEKMTKHRFGRDWFDDESDAYRHFIWTGLLVKELGAELAQKFLDAHESASSATNPGRIMDEKNNKLAMKYVERLSKSGKLNAEELEKEALGALKRKELIVLRPLGGSK